ncbi:auxin efflux carrier [Cristinia sonorae]|uniref:Auxin efflux carrier n=1 Tax=Cristinia sonorae TaxID=1940300 RepID=A0A8K0UL40_9AGAR|nr:auxin efflux carrier [Cristinia sonorae]
MPSAGFLIYSGVMPLIKMFMAILCGFVMARRGLFPKAAARGASEIAMNISLPALMFANIVPAFTPQNISALGPLFLLAFVYQFIGFFFGMLIREICYVPRNFWQGIVIVTGMSNWGNLPNAVVLTVTQQPPFDPLTDPALGVSYVAIFIVSYNLVFWVFGAARSLSWDYLPGVPQGQDAELRNLTWKEKPLGSLVSRYIIRKPSKTIIGLALTSIGKSEATENNEKSPSSLVEHPAASSRTPSIHGSVTSRHASITTIPVPSPPAAPVLEQDPATSVHRGQILSVPPVISRALQPVLAAMHPVTIALLVSLPIALLNPLKALFVDIADIGGPTYRGPDGRPPLAFIIDTAELLGNIAVPLALILLGASFARLQIPRPISRLPLPAMISVAVAKMVVLPVIGVIIVQGMVRSGMIPHEARVEKFVGMLLSGTPAAVNQLIVASLYAPDGNVDMYSAFFLVQYVIMFLSASVLTAVSLLLS